MTLKHPTIADQVWERRLVTKTPISKLVADVSHDVERGWDDCGCWIEYTFEDDTSIYTRGRGKYQYVEVRLP